MSVRDAKSIMARRVTTPSSSRARTAGTPRMKMEQATGNGLYAGGGKLMNIFGKTVPALTGAVLFFASTAGAEFAAAQAPRPAEQAFKNIQVLKGVPENEIQPTMWFFSASLGVRC